MTLTTFLLLSCAQNWTAADTAGRPMSSEEAAATQSAHHECTGITSYEFEWPVQLDYGDEPPDAWLWYRLGDDYLAGRAAYYQALVDTGSADSVPVSAVVVGLAPGGPTTLSADGRWLGSCNFVSWSLNGQNFGSGFVHSQLDLYWR